MFTGLVEELGTVVELVHAREGMATAPPGARLTIRAPKVATDARHGDSVAVNGVCLTVVDTGARDTLTGFTGFSVDVIAETLERSSLGALRPGSPVNLERPVRLSDRLGGHLVQGHVDAVGEVLARTPDDVVRVSLPARLARYVVAKGSITVDGVSLTVVEAAADWFSVALIPTTLELTTLGRKGPGDPVNLEVDVIAKYVERLLEAREARGASEPPDRSEPLGTREPPDAREAPETREPREARA
jgi:riboflavin synthase